MKPDQQRIHELEFELGFRDDAPPERVTLGPQSTITVDRVLKELWTQDVIDRSDVPEFDMNDEADRLRWLAVELHDGS